MTSFCRVSRTSLAGHTHTHAHTHTHTCTHAHARICTRAYARTHMHTHTQTYTHTHTQTNTHTLIHAHAYTHTQAHTHSHTHTHTHSHTMTCSTISVSCLFDFVGAVDGGTYLDVLLPETTVAMARVMLGLLGTLRDVPTMLNMTEGEREISYGGGSSSGDKSSCLATGRLLVRSPGSSPS